MTLSVISFAPSAYFPSKQETSHLGQRGMRIGIDGIVRTSGPQRVFVQLQAFVHNAAEHHRAQTAIANRESPDPFRRTGPTATAAVGMAVCKGDRRPVDDTKVSSPRRAAAPRR